MIVTTSARGQERLEKKAKQVTNDLQCRYVRRNKHSIERMAEFYQADYVIVVTKQDLKLVAKGYEKEPFFFHPSSAMFRVKRLQRGEHDPMVDACQLKTGMTVFDGTLGLGSDAIVASYTVGPSGKVTGVESVPVLSYIVKEGLQHWKSNSTELNEAMRRIEVRNRSYGDALRAAENHSYDIVYFDPMFDQTVSESIGLAPLKSLANYEPLTREAIEEARRVARKRVVLKESSYSPRFEELGFTPLVRKYASFWFGTIEME